MTEEQHTLWVRKIAEAYEPLVEEINDLVTNNFSNKIDARIMLGGIFCIF